MRIIYFTTAQDKNEFKRTLSKWRVSPNLSNQNFHNKLIRALSLDKEVKVISVRPINSHFKYPILYKKVVIENNITWKYVKVTTDKINKKLFLNSRINNATKDHKEDDIVIVDTLNMSLLKAAVKFARKNNLKIIGVVTDNPLNISYTTDKYRHNLLELGQSLDGYICLTESLNNLYNTSNKPFVIIDGVTEKIANKEPVHKIEGDYIFFGGSLMKRYGVYNLIKAFDELEIKDLKLVLCGHHEEKSFKEYIKHFINIIYLGALDYDEANAIQNKALIAINPRPNDENVDDYSFPSKTLEYLANGVLTVTVRNKILESRYKDEIIWAESGSIEDLKAALTKALSLSEKEREQIKKLSIQTVEKRTSFEMVNSIISKLL